MTGTACYGGLHLGYLSRYLSPSHPLYDASLDDFLDLAIKDIGILSGTSPNSIIERSYPSIAFDAQAITRFGYCRNPMRLSDSDNIYLCNIPMTYPDERGLNNAIQLGKSISKLMISSPASI